MKRTFLTVGILVLGLALSLWARSAWAVPILQLYLEGGTYNEETQSWELTPAGSSSGEPFRLWVIGNVDGPGGMGTIKDVRLSVVYDEGVDIGITLMPTTAGGEGSFNGIADPSTPDDPVQFSLIQTSLGEVDTSETGGIVTNGSTPVLGDGSPLPAHGEFGDGRVWREWNLGDMGMTDSDIGDFIGGFPTELFADAGMINVYDVTVTGGHGVTLHYDVYNHVEGGNHVKYKFAPFSHDADGDVNVIPEPATLAIWSVLGLVGAGGYWRSRRKRAARSSAA
jgi:hypothetical protein